MINLIESFLKTGCLGQLKLGLSFEQVQEIIGSPGDNLHRATRTRLVWQLGGVQLSFGKRKLDIISLKFKEGETLIPEQVAGQEIKVSLPILLEDFKAFLANLNIKNEPYLRD